MDKSDHLRRSSIVFYYLSSVERIKPNTQRQYAAVTSTMTQLRSVDYCKQSLRPALSMDGKVGYIGIQALLLSALELLDRLGITPTPLQDFCVPDASWWKIDHSAELQHGQVYELCHNNLSGSHTMMT